MSRAGGGGAVSLLLCIVLSACTPRVTIDDARREASAAQATLKHAIELQTAGRQEEAVAEGRRAQDRMYSARDKYLTARADISRNTDVLIEFAEFVEELGDADLAGEAYLRAARLRPEEARLWYRAGRDFVDAGGRYLGQAAEPLDRAEALIHAKPGAVSVAEIETTRGDISWKSGAYDIAAKKYAEALAADASAIRARIGAACAALALGDPARAESALNELQTIPPADGSVLQARLREAYLAFRKSKTRLPESALAYRALAGVAVQTGFLADARAAIEHALTLDPRDVFSWNMDGSLAEAAGDAARARLAYTRSLELQADQPRTKEALERLGAAAVAPGAPK